MTKIAQVFSMSDSYSFQAQKSKKVELSFTADEISSDGGLMILREVDRRLQLTKRVAEIIPDPRDPRFITHPWQKLLQQRVYAIAAGYEDLNDHQDLRKDSVMQLALEREDVLGSSSTLCRFEDSLSKSALWKTHQILVDQWLDSYEKEPEEIILDFDATDLELHGNQEGKFYHGYYREYCYLPIHVFCKNQLLVSYLKPANKDAAKHSWAIFSLLVKAIRKRFSSCRILFRGDSGFCRYRLFEWCEKQENVFYLTGIGKHSILSEEAKEWIDQSQQLFDKTNEKQRIFGEFKYAAGTWKKRVRRVIVKAETTALGKNTRFVITNLEEDPQAIYDQIYCARGKMEQSISEQMDFFSDRMSSHFFRKNQFRMILSALAYTLLETIRSQALKGTELEKSKCSTIRLKLIKVGTLVLKNTRRIKLMCSKSFAYQDLFFRVLHHFQPT